MNFPKAEAVTEIEALANRLRAALFRLDLMSNCASLLEIGTLRRGTHRGYKYVGG